jgi:hypothetical protein
MIYTYIILKNGEFGRKMEKKGEKWGILGKTVN